MNKVVVKKWIAALRSGDYKQCCGKLHIGNRFCVLGVLCDIYLKEEGDEWKKDQFYSEMCKLDVYRCGPNLDILPRVVEQWANINMGGTLLNYDVQYDETVDMTDITHVQSLTSLNDSGMSFESLTDIIEKKAKHIDPSFVV